MFLAASQSGTIMYLASETFEKDLQGNILPNFVAPLQLIVIEIEPDPREFQPVVQTSPTS